MVLAVFLLGVTACTNTAPETIPTSAPNSSKAGSHSASPAAGVDKVLVIVDENRSIGEVSAHMPFLMSQARFYGIATNYFAISHPSLPNYLVLAGGTTFGIADDGDPAVHRLRGPSVFGRLLAAGRTAKTYAEAMPSHCARRNHAIYVVRHNPWTYFDDPAERAACEKFDVPLGSPTTGALIDDLTAGKLPTFGLVAPDLCHDGHDCSAATADDWLRSWLPVIKKGPDFTSRRLAIVVTWDEDDDHSGNHIPLAVIHPSVQGKEVATRLDHYGLSGSVARVGGIASLRNTDKGTDVLAAFGLPRD
jgi:phosphatidylinositol-3-phosphatase